MHKGWWTSDSGNTYYYDENGWMTFGSKKIDGHYYNFKSTNGIMHKGWWTSDSGNTYYYDENGWMTFGSKKIDGHYYNFKNTNGIMHKGWWTSDKGYTYYYDENGWMTFGWKTIDGTSYYFSESNGILLDSKKEQLTKIEGASSVTIDQMVRFYEKCSPIDYPAEPLAKGGAPTLKEFATIYYEEASKENIKVEVAWAQTMHETGWLMFGGQVDIGQFNFAGLGATDGGAKGADFSSYGKNGVRIGVRAQIQHLKAYADPDIAVATLQHACVDPRFQYVNPKGCAQYVEYLGQKENPDGKGWATAERYGYKILDLMGKLKEM